MSLQLVVIGADSRVFVGLPSASDADEVYAVNNSVAKEGLSAIGNRHLGIGNCDVIGICHADVHFGPGALRVLESTAAAGAVAGIVGIDLGRTYRWGKDNPGPVSTLDSCSVFFRRDSGLRFDENTFNSLHCHVEDLCLQAQAKGIPVVVPAAIATHDGESTERPEWQAEYWRYRELLARKWSHVRFETT